MESGSPLSPFVELPAVLRGLLTGIAGWYRMLSQPVLLLSWGYVSRLAGKMERLSARFVAGKAMTRAASGERVVVSRGAALAGTAAGPRVWPGRFGWMVRRVGCQATGFGSQLEHQLRQPEMVALLTASAQARRLLRPVCRMLGIDASLLQPGVPAKVAAPLEPVVKRTKRVLPPLDWGRIPLPRGALAAAKRQGFGRRRDYFGKGD